MNQLRKGTYDWWGKAVPVKKEAITLFGLEPFTYSLDGNIHDNGRVRALTGFDVKMRLAADRYALSEVRVAPSHPWSVYLEMPGKAPDVLVQSEDQFNQSGLRFYSVPSTTS